MKFVGEEVRRKVHSCTIKTEGNPIKYPITYFRNKNK